MHNSDTTALYHRCTGFPVSSNGFHTLKSLLLSLINCISYVFWPSLSTSVSVLFRSASNILGLEL